ncbi:DnaJ domain-containing protein [Tsuneonella sp. HG222]
MNSASSFVDYYARLQVNFDCSPRELEGAYHRFAKLYHPDSSATADVDRFSETVEAYRVLRDPETRSDYDRSYFQEMGIDPAIPETHANGQIKDPDAIEDGAAHTAILLKLYKQRRQSPGEPGIPAYVLEEMVGCTNEQMDFHAWYLKAKGLVEITEQGTLAITVEGVDLVIAASRSPDARPLYIADFNG